MASYTNEEINAVVQQIVTTNISRPFTVLGTRDTSSVYNQLQEQALNVFANSETALYYCILQGTALVQELVLQEEALIRSLLLAVRSVARNVAPVRDLSSISNAISALTSLEGAVSSRKNGFSDVSSTPSFQLFDKNINRFLDSNGAAVKSGSSIVQTPLEAQNSIPGLVSSWRDLHEKTLLAKLLLLALAESSFDQVELPVLVAQNVIRRTRALLQTRHQTLEALNEQQRTAQIRQTVLELLAAKALVKKYGNFAKPAATRSVRGLGTAFADASRVANPAALFTTVSGPYAVVKTQSTNQAEAGNYLDLWLNRPVTPKFQGTFTGITPISGKQATISGTGFNALGLAPTDVVYLLSGANERTRWTIDSYTDTELVVTGLGYPIAETSNISGQVYPSPDLVLALPLSNVATLEGQISEPFNLTAGVDNELRLLVDGTVTVTATLAPGTAVDALSVCDDINAVLPTSYRAAPYFAPLKFSGDVSTEPTVGGAIFTLPFSGNPPVRSFTPIAPLNIDLGISIGDRIAVTEGPNAGQLHQITAFDSQTATTTLLTGGPVVSSSADTIELGNTNRRIRIKHADPASGVPAQSSIQVLTPLTIHRNTAQKLGYFGQISSTCYPTKASDLVSFINAVTRDVKASLGHSPVITTGLFTSDLQDARAVRCLRGSFVADLTSGTSITITTKGLSAAGVQVGDVGQIRSGGNANAVFTITGVADDTTATANVSIPGGGIDVNTAVTVDIGPDLNIQYGWLLRVADGPNSGDYRVTSVDSAIPWRFLTDGVLPIRQQELSLEFSFTGDFGPEVLAISSLDTSLASRVSSIGLAHSTFFAPFLSNTTPITAIGTTLWFQLPNIPPNVTPGDTIDTYPTHYNVVDKQYSIRIINRSDRVVKISPAISSDANWNFSENSLPPFARVTVSLVNNYTTFRSSLEDWLALPINKTTYFQNLSAKLNPVVSNKNPSAIAVSDAISEIYLFYERLTTQGASETQFSGATLEAILNSYTCPPDVGVDLLVKSLRERGSDRAIELLLSGDFKGFFGCTEDGASFSGRVRELMRDIGRLDLPVRKTGRQDTSTRRVLAQTEGTDFEYSDADLDPATTPENASDFQPLAQTEAWVRDKCFGVILHRLSMQIVFDHVLVSEWLAVLRLAKFLRIGALATYRDCPNDRLRLAELIVIEIAHRRWIGYPDTLHRKGMRY